MSARKYALTRVAAGDYICPSNDRTMLWRFVRIWEDGSAFQYNEDGTERPIVGHFWEAYRMPFPDSVVWDRAVDDDDLWTLPWQCVSMMHKTRREVITVMEREQEKVA